MTGLASLCRVSRYEETVPAIGLFPVVALAVAPLAIDKSRE